jgi:capsular exopolysaccharide synthesis family protein
MSRLFEALQISESERSGSLLSQVPAVATELFQVAERKDQELGECPVLHVSPAPESRLVTLTDKQSLGAEKFRFLAVRLRQMQQQSGSLKKILVTSTIAEEGKSLISANLAITLARRYRQKVLLVEGDLRRPVLSQQFGLGMLPGLSESLQGDATAGRNLYYLDEPRLWFIPAGQPPENPLELMQSGRLAEVLDQFWNGFDWVVIDSPPLLPLADTTVWSRAADGVLMVAREGITQRRALKRGIEALGKSTLVGVVINSCADVDQSNYYQRYAPPPRATNSTAPEPGNG